ncbi:class I SAM-dependent methyltransferase [Pelagibius litoralis]|uniref:Class I SAM-dependent methyltransferase n=1 Tax=Pelagibius litoralis TaxID=374515 RepID=A0A967EZL5_9PROT|nr:class I SAM-dependent methyltransferase [Pelagibius litoralis]NIA70326.1 class I SAM-dependent methyltransferase [Pelagibius litoralis]
MKAYYCDQVIHIAEDYDIEKRISIIQNFFRAEQIVTLLDYGSNSERHFHHRLRQLEWEVDTIDVISDERTLKNKYDIITSYFVLEHILSLDEIFETFRDLSTLQTKLIIEVPGVEIYDRDYSGLLHEHQQHFQITSLQALAARFGFNMLSSSWDDCSRKFGFVSVFEFVGHAEKPVLAPVMDAPSRYMKGRECQVQANTYYPQKFFEDFGLRRFKVFAIWGINENFEKLMSVLKGGMESIVALDMNPDKAGYVDDRSVYFHPSKFIEGFEVFLEETGLVSDDVCFICTAPSHVKDIEPRIRCISNNFFTYDPSATSV